MELKQHETMQKEKEPMSGKKLFGIIAGDFVMAPVDKKAKERAVAMNPTT